MSTPRKKPETKEERAAVHRRLLQFAERASATGVTKGLPAYLTSFNDEPMQRQIFHWLKEYTAIREIGEPSGALAFHVPKNLRGDALNLEDARLNAYWTFDIPKAEVPPARRATPEPKRLQPAAHQLTDREYQQRRLQLAFAEFIDRRDGLSKRKLLDLIEQTTLRGESTRGGAPVMQGGAPGLRQQR